jgi:hypothetical protein
MSLDPEGTPAEREARLRETYRLMLLRDLRGAEFLRLLRLAHSEGLLAESMQAAGLRVIPTVYRHYAALRHYGDSALISFWPTRGEQRRSPPSRILCTVTVTGVTVTGRNCRNSSTLRAVDLLAASFSDWSGLSRTEGRCAAARRAVLDRPDQSEVLQPRGRRRSLRRTEDARGEAADAEGRFVLRAVRRRPRPPEPDNVFANCRTRATMDFRSPRRSPLATKAVAQQGIFAEARVSTRGGGTLWNRPRPCQGKP